MGNDLAKREQEESSESESDEDLEDDETSDSEDDSEEWDTSSGDSSGESSSEEEDDGVSRVRCGFCSCRLDIACRHGCRCTLCPARRVSSF